MQRDVAVPQPEVAKPETGKGRQVAEFIFVVVVAAVSLLAFLAVLSYDIISARAPLCILAPLFILIGIQFNRTRKTVDLADVCAEIGNVVSGQRQRFKAIAALAGWMAFLLTIIFVIGHYAGMAVFLLIMLRRVAAQTWRMTLIVTALVTSTVYVLFEYLFNLELYRGLLMNLVASALA